VNGEGNGDEKQKHWNDSADSPLVEPRERDSLDVKNIAHQQTGQTEEDIDAHSTYIGRPHTWKEVVIKDESYCESPPSVEESNMAQACMSRHFGFSWGAPTRRCDWRLEATLPITHCSCGRRSRSIRILSQFASFRSFHHRHCTSPYSVVRRHRNCQLAAHATTKQVTAHR
jgi:hypothetical protein